MCLVTTFKVLDPASERSGSDSTEFETALDNLQNGGANIITDETGDPSNVLATHISLFTVEIRIYRIGSKMQFRLKSN